MKTPSNILLPLILVGNLISINGNIQEQNLFQNKDVDEESAGTQDGVIKNDNRRSSSRCNIMIMNPDDRSEYDAEVIFDEQFNGDQNWPNYPILQGWTNHINVLLLKEYIPLNRGQRQRKPRKTTTTEARLVPG